MKTKFLLLVLLMGLINFSCSDDNDDPVVILKADKLNINEGIVGDEVVLTGEGFSENKEENIVSFNEVQATILQASASELKVIVPEGATTGNLTVKVADKSIDFGVFTVKKEILFFIKAKYSNDDVVSTIVSLDPATGEELDKYELPVLEEDVCYSSMTYLAKTNEIAILAVDEENGKNISLYKMNLETKNTTKVDLQGEDRFYYWEMVSDKDDNLYLNKTSFTGDAVYLMKVDPVTGKQKVFYQNSESDIIEFVYLNYLEETNEIVMAILNNDNNDTISKLFKINLENGTKSEIALSQKGNYEALGADNANNLYLLKDGYDENQPSKILKLDQTTGSEETIHELKKPNYCYTQPVYLESTNELVYCPFDEEGTDQFLLKVNLETKATKEIVLNNSEVLYYESMIKIYR
ncbi:MAG: IPT/TIG domain-containing protein [Marinifilaceae bacterium]